MISSLDIKPLLAVEDELSEPAADDEEEVEADDEEEEEEEVEPLLQAVSCAQASTTAAAAANFFLLVIFILVTCLSKVLLFCLFIYKLSLITLIFCFAKSAFPQSSKSRTKLYR